MPRCSSSSTGLSVIVLCRDPLVSQLWLSRSRHPKPLTSRGGHVERCRRLGYQNQSNLTHQMELSISRFNAGAHNCFLFWIGVFGWLCFTARLAVVSCKGARFSPKL